jgi:hypothetical protein
MAAQNEASIWLSSAPTAVRNTPRSRCSSAHDPRSSNPVNHTTGAYPTAGQLLVHELTHAWQIAHASFLPGFICQGIVNQTNYTVGQNVYIYGPPGPPWGSFNLEGEGAIVDQWFAGTPTPWRHIASTEKYRRVSPPESRSTI